MAEQRSYTGGFDNRWLFTGKELDESTGLDYFGARFYNPSTSIWLSVDTLVEQTMDIYGYCYQNPIYFIDPDGRIPMKSSSDPKLPKFLNDFFAKLEKKAGPAIEEYSKAIEETIASFHPGVAVANMYKGATEGKDIFDNNISNAEIGFEIAGFLTIFKVGGKFLKIADKQFNNLADFYKEISKFDLGERIIKYREVAKEVVKENKWVKNNNLSKKTTEIFLQTLKEIIIP